MVTLPALKSPSELDFHTATVRWFSDRLGYGFIAHPHLGDVLVHHSVIQMDGYRTLSEGDVVRFKVYLNHDRYRATVVYIERYGNDRL